MLLMRTACQSGKPFVGTVKAYFSECPSTLTMRFNGIGTGLAVSFLLFFPVGYLDILLAFNNSVGNWAVSALMLPYLVYFGMAVILRWGGYGGLGKGLAVGGAVFSTLIVIGIFFIALMFSMLADA